MNARRGVAGLVVVLLALAGCGNPVASRPQAPAAANVGGAGFEDVRPGDLLRSYAAANNHANAGFLVNTVSTFEQDPAALASTAGLRAAAVMRQAIPAAEYLDPRFYFPADQTFPRFFLTTATLARSGSIAPRPKYLIFVQDAANAPWRVAFYPYLAEDGTHPAPAADATGSVPKVTGTDDLVADPNLLPGLYLQYAEGARDSNVPIAPARALTEQLEAGYRAGVADLAGRGGTLTRTKLPDSYPSYLVRTVDGGVLAFGAVRVRDVMAATAPGGTVSLAPSSAESLMLGRIDGASAGRFTVDRLLMFLSYVPPRSAPGPGVRVLAYGDYPIAVTAQ